MLARGPEGDWTAAQVRSLGSQVRLDARTKLLNPKWYEGMLSSGYEGVREIQKRLTNTVGWSATSGAVDNWVYDEVRLQLSSWHEKFQLQMLHAATHNVSHL